MYMSCGTLNSAVSHWINNGALLDSAAWLVLPVVVKMQTACRSRSLDTRALSDAAAWWRRELTVDQSADQPLVVMSKWLVVLREFLAVERNKNLMDML